MLTAPGNRRKEDVFDRAKYFGGTVPAPNSSNSVNWNTCKGLVVFTCTFLIKGTVRSTKTNISVWLFKETL